MGRNRWHGRRLNGNDRFTLLLVLVTLVSAWVMDFRPGARTSTAPRTSAPIARTASAPPVDTTDPQAGVHTRLTLVADRGTIRKELQMVRDMGASWIVEYFPWLYLQPDGPDTYDWKHADLVIDEAHRQGLTVIARIDGVPAWARPANTSWKYLDATGYPAYARLVAAFAARYQGIVTQIVVWNEPNLSLEWGLRPVDPVGYADLLRTVYPTAKQANPDVQILAAGLAPTTEPDGSPLGLDDLTYLNRLYDAGAAPYFDALAMHIYGGTHAPDADPGTDPRTWRHAERVRAIMVAHGDSAKPAYITEGGWNDSPRFDGAVRPADRVRDTVAAYRYAQEQWPWARTVALWEFRLPTLTHTAQDNWTFVTPDFLPKPIYLEVQRALRPTKESGG
jgi:hypothetical protein